VAPKSPRRKGALQQAKEYLRINPSATNSQVVEALNVSIGTVSAARSFLVQTGVIQRSFYDRSSPQIEGELPEDYIPGPVLATSGVSDLEKEMAARAAVEAATQNNGLPLTAEEQRQRLSTVARNAAITGNFQLEIAAIQALARLDAQIGARDRLGPGPPLTDDDKIHRLSLILQAVGKRIARKAWERTFNEGQQVVLEAAAVSVQGTPASDIGQQVASPCSLDSSSDDSAVPHDGGLHDHRD